VTACRGFVLPMPAPVARRVVVVAGPTAVGKSALGMRLCEALPGELVSVDSVQVYRGLQIGANKPSAVERARTAHHLIDVAELSDDYTAGTFYADALTAVDEVLSRGKTPVLVGGTSMYLRWLVHGRPTAPRSDPAVAAAARDALQPYQEAADWEGGLALLRALDGPRAAQLSANDWYRLHRALVVAMQTRSQAAALPPPPDDSGLDALRASLDLRCFFLTAPRVPLCRRIDERCGAMLQAGLLREVSDLLLQRKLLPSHPAGRAIGYRQALEYLLRPCYAPRDADALSSFVHAFAAASRRYAQQQTKWFRSETSFEWVDVDWSAPEAAAERVLASVRKPRLEHEDDLAAPRQAEMRAVKPDEGKAMKRYVERHDALEDVAVCEALLREADACCEALQAARADLLAADEALAERYPWHAADAGGEGGTGSAARAAQRMSGWSAARGADAGEPGGAS